MRITQKDLDAVVRRINRIAGFTDEAKLWQHVDGRNVATVGMYALDGAYGGWKLVRIMSEGGGQTSITSGFSPKRELYDQMQAFIRGMETCRETN